MLRNSHVLELGAGTGLLSIALSPLVREYTVTDIAALLPLIRKNLSLNFDGWPAKSNVSVEELDWERLHASTPALRAANFSYSPIDVILAVDCIYHPSLLPCLVDTIDFLAAPGKTAVLVVVELRAEDVVREFLERWLGTAGWEVWRVALPVDGVLDKPYVGWMGRKG
jgi:predicted nicotinamide N-methyase